MANITTCSRCHGLYEAGSEEQANEPGRTCLTCTKQLQAKPGVESGSKELKEGEKRS